MKNKCASTLDFLSNRETTLKDTFRNIHEINTILGIFTKQADFLKEISVNSAIAAGHVSAESSALSEIAKQIGVLSQYLSESVSEAHSITTQISNNILHCILSNGSTERMAAASILLGHESINTQVRINEVIEDVEQTIQCLICRTKKSLKKLNPLFTRLRQVINRTWSLIMALKVSSGVEEGEEDSFFIPIAKSLEAMAEESLKYTEEITIYIYQVCGSLKTLGKNHEEESNAA